VLAFPLLRLSLLGELDLFFERPEPQLGSAMPGCSDSSSGGVLVVCCWGWGARGGVAAARAAVLTVNWWCGGYFVLDAGRMVP
jgi:hypothetical protein